MSDTPPPPTPPVPPSTPGEPQDGDRPADGAETSGFPYGAAPDRFPPPESESGAGYPGNGPSGFGASPFGDSPYGQSPYGQSPYGQSSHQRPAAGQPGHPQPGHPQSGHPQSGHPQSGHPQSGYPQSGHPQSGYPQSGYAQGSGGGASASRGPKRGLAIAALIIGCVSILFALIPFIGYVAIVTALVGLVLGIIALVQAGGSRGFALGGLITSAAALILAITLSIVYTNLIVSAVEDEIGSLDSPVSPDDQSDDPLDEGAATGPGSRDDPDAIGSTVEFTGIDDLPAWEVTLGSPTLDANAIVAADEYNDPPPDGTQYAILPLTITYIGDATGFPYDIEVQFVAADGTSYDTDDVYAVIPEDLYDANELFPGGSVTGNVVIPIPTDGIEGGTWAVSAAYSDPYFFSVQ